MTDILSREEIRTSKRLTYILRHGAAKMNITMTTGGYVNLGQIMQLKDFKRMTIQEVERIVRFDSKQRFGLEKVPLNDPSQWMIRANQGHSIQNLNDEDLLMEITDVANAPPVCIHGTYLKSWESIYHVGLCRMKRNHIHFAIGEVNDGEVISGMRTSVQIKVYVDVVKAMQDGIKFYCSQNNVILCPGVGEQGLLDRKYFSKVVRCSDNGILYTNNQD